MSVLKTESYKRGILFSTVLNVVNKGVTFLNGLVVAHYFGVKAGTDIFFYIYNSVMLLGVFITSLNGSVLIPESTKVRITEGETRAMQFLNFFIAGYFILLIICLGLIVIDPVSFFSVISGFGTTNLEANRHLLYLALPLFLLNCLIVLFTDIFSSYRFFTMPMIVGIINGIISILAILIFHDQWEIKSIFYALVFAYTFNFLMLLFLMKKSLNWKFNIRWMKIERRIWQNIGFAQVGNLASTVSAYMPMYILSGFNAGVITALTFAQQISSLPTTLITNQFSAVAGIKFNELYAKNEKAEIGKVFSRACSFLLFVMTPIGFFIYLYARPIIQLFLGSSKLGPEGLNNATTFIKYLGFLLPLFVINTLFSRVFMATYKIREAFWYQVIFNVVLSSCLFLGVKMFGIIGYPLTLVGLHVLNVLFCYFLQKFYFDFIGYAVILKNFLLVLLLNAAISFIVFQMMKSIKTDNPFAVLSISFLIYLILLFAINKMLRINSTVNEQVSVLFKKLATYGISKK
jgi:putative peptidoglycan lipid II flippase